MEIIWRLQNIDDKPASSPNSSGLHSQFLLLVAFRGFGICRSYSVFFINGGKLVTLINVWKCWCVTVCGKVGTKKGWWYIFASCLIVVKTTEMGLNKILRFTFILLYKSDAIWFFVKHMNKMLRRHLYIIDALNLLWAIVLL